MVAVTTIGGSPQNNGGSDNVGSQTPTPVSGASSGEEITIGPSPGIITLAVLLSVAVAALVVWASVRHRLRAARSRSRFEAFVELQAANSALPPPPPPPPPPAPTPAYDVPVAGMAGAAAMPGMGAGFGAGMPAQPPLMGGVVPGSPGPGPFPRGVWGPGQDPAAMAAAAASQQQQAGCWRAGLSANMRDAEGFGRWQAPGAAARRRRDTFPAADANAPGWPRQRYRGGMASDERPSGNGAYESDGDGPRVRRKRRSSAMSEKFGRRRRGRGEESDGLEGSTLCASSSSDSAKGKHGHIKDWEKDKSKHE